ncbi:Apolipoprotein N-acyltransferase [Halomicronema hongdechloris C2206]|uniref:Apolipoprotein N-acyltransferase n=2 Tax=Halomicronema hongdechloris TaxID=1209493 RepID=A0A1Z3HFP7_9CYAN|nr:Apolipoprotein N-acyltransferase [Halomicronema hongdechloris C2206]
MTTVLSLGKLLTSYGLTPGRGWLLAALGGVLMAMAPAPLGLWPLAWLALVPLWRLLAQPQTTYGRALRYGSIWGMAYNGIALAWITHLHPLTWMGVPWLGSLGIALFAWGAIVLWGAILVMVWSLAMVWCHRYYPTVTRLLLGVGLWCLLESLWSASPLTWTSLSFTQSPGNLWILHLGRLSGQFTVTAVIVAVNGCLAEIWHQQRNRRHVLGLAVLALLIGSHAIGWGLYRQPLADTAHNAIEVGIIQGNVPTRIKLTPAGVRLALRRYAEGYRTLATAGVDAVLTPEGALPFAWGTDFSQRTDLYQAVRQLKVPLWLGAFGPVADEHLAQSLLTITGDGQVTGRYDKVKLVPLGEYIPLESILSQLINRLSPLESYLVPGSPDQRFQTPFGPAIVGICYESVYGHQFRRQAVQGGRFILTASNNDPYPSGMMAQHHAQDLMRAIETDRWAARATNTGLSGVVDPHGHTLWLSQPNTYTVHRHTIYQRQTRTLYVRWGNWLTLGLIGLAGISLIWPQRNSSATS